MALCLGVFFSSYAEPPLAFINHTSVVDQIFVGGDRRHSFAPFHFTKLRGIIRILSCL